ncbi:unnamed protein product [Effrenium voratum]|nr:unnamed protein product [Effrenium voratum]
MDAERRAARAYLEQRRPVSDKEYEGEVLSSGRGFAWVRMDEPGDEVPADVLQTLKEMTAAVKRKSQSRGKDFGDVQYVVYVGSLDLRDSSKTLRPGTKVRLKLYCDTRGVGGHDVEVTDQPVTVPEEVQAAAEDAEERERKPRYMRFFENKVAEEERQVLDGCYEGEVVRRAKTYAWIRPLDAAAMPEEVREKLQEMCDGFRKKAEDGGRKPFCGGIEENVVYVANPDLSTKGTILSVGMKVSFKLYVDNKGVGGYDVLPSQEHIEKMLLAIRANFETEEGKRKSLKLKDVFGEPPNFKDVLFVGECTHAFSLAAGRLLGVMPFAGAAEHPYQLPCAWCSTELQWPRTLEKKLELDLVDNIKLLRSKGVWCADGIDGLKLQQSLEKAKCPTTRFNTVFWMMPYVPDRQWRPPASIGIMMHYYIQAYVESAAALCKDDGQVVVVVTSAQCLSWNLYNCNPSFAGRELIPEVWWFDVSPFERHGYQSRFGDGRDRYVDQPVFHRLCDTVAVCWKTKQREAEEVEGVTEDEIAARKKLLEEIGKDPTVQQVQQVQVQQWHNQLAESQRLSTQGYSWPRPTTAWSPQINDPPEVIPPNEVVAERRRQFGDRLFRLWVEDVPGRGVRVHALDTTSFLRSCVEFSDLDVQAMFDHWFFRLARSHQNSLAAPLTQFLLCLLDAAYFQLEGGHLRLRVPAEIPPLPPEPDKELIEVPAYKASPTSSAAPLTKEWIRDKLLVPRSMVGRSTSRSSGGYSCYSRGQGAPHAPRPSSARTSVLASWSMSEMAPSPEASCESERPRSARRRPSGHPPGLRVRRPLEEREKASGFQPAPQASRRLRPASAKVHKHKRVAEAWGHDGHDIYDDLEPSIAGDLDHFDAQEAALTRAVFETLEPTVPPGGPDAKLHQRHLF